MATYAPPLKPVSPRQSRINRLTFRQAMAEYENEKMREALTDAKKDFSLYLQLYWGMGQDAADGTAEEFFAACVWAEAKGKVKT